MKKIILLLLTIITMNSLFITKAFAGSDITPPLLDSEAAIIMEANTGTILYEKNANVQMYPASLTKIATAIYAIEMGNLEEIVTVSSNAINTEGTTVYLEEGENVPLKKLLQGLLINSGNDAAIAIAEKLSGSVEQFSIDLNVYLKRIIDLQDTNFENPHGLFDPNHVTTAKDLAKITQYAMQNETFRQIFGTKELDWDGETWDTTLITHHKLLKGEIPYDGVTGGKNGFIDQSGYTLATTAEKDGLSLVVITLNNSIKNDAYYDTMGLLDYGFENFKNSYIEKGTTFTIGDEEYVASEKIAYTHSLQEKLKNQVTGNGTLSIVNQAGNLIGSFQLDKVKPGNKIDKYDKAATQTTIDKNSIPSLLLYLLAGLILIAIGILYRKNHKV